MKNTEISVKNLYIGEIRCFNTALNLTYIPEKDQKGYAFLVDVNGVYINPFNPLEGLPVYSRTCYSSYTINGEPHGNKIEIAYGEVKDGKCYVIDYEKPEDIFDKDTVTIKDLEDYMFKADKFFVDRITIGKEGCKPRDLLYRYVQMEKDCAKKMKLDMFLEEEEKTLVKAK
ncbi:MAG: hypothetical protein IJI58_00610 [Bacilli bacterium]|nr:hypothetical protein [Bacilli bacterium]